MPRGVGVRIAPPTPRSPQFNRGFFHLRGFADIPLPVEDDVGCLRDSQAGALVVELFISVRPEDILRRFDCRCVLPVHERRLLHREMRVSGAEQGCGTGRLASTTGEGSGLQQGEPAVDGHSGVESGPGRRPIQTFGPIELAGIPDRVGEAVKSKRLDETIGAGLFIRSMQNVWPAGDGAPQPVEVRQALRRDGRP